MFETTEYFKYMKNRPDRADIQDEWIAYGMTQAVHEEIQTDGRIRRWAQIKEADGRFLRVILLPDGKTVHNAFFDCRLKEK